LIHKEKPIVLFERHCHVTEKSEDIARSCQSSRLTRWWTQKRIIGKKCRAKEEERHKGLLTQKSLCYMIYQLTTNKKNQNPDDCFLVGT
jgi:hypothetical protein